MRSLSLLPLIFLISFTLRIVNIYIFPPDIELILQEDAKGYLLLTVDPDSFFYFWSNYYSKFDGEKFFGYPLLLSFIFFVFGSTDIYNVFLVQSGFDSVGVILFYGIVRLLAFEKYTAIIATIFYLANVNIIIHTSSILTESFALFFLLGFLYSVLSFIKYNKTSMVIFAATSIALACALRYQLLIFLPIFFVIVGFRLRGDFRKRVMVATVCIILSLSTVIIQVFINHSRYHTFAISSQSGTHLYSWVYGAFLANQTGLERAAIGSLLEKNYEAYLEGANLDIDSVNPFQASTIKSKLAFKGMADIELSSFVSLSTASVLGTLFVPAVLVDKRVRSLKGISFSKDTQGSLVQRVQTFFQGVSWNYLQIALLATILTAGSYYFVLVGGFIAIRTHFFFVCSAAALIAIFLAMSVPVISPKYRLFVEPIFSIFAACGARYYLGRILK